MRILFIGNSYTFYNKMPQTFAALCAERGKEVEVESVTSGGYTLASYLEPTDIFARRIAEKLAGEKYDYVVLQEQSVRPANEPERFFAPCRILADMIAKNGAEILFYQTWGRRDDNTMLEQLGMTHEQMHEALKVSYERIAEELGARVVYAGDAMHRAYRGYAGAAVYHDDGTHPGPLGSQIIAEAFYEAIFG